MYSILIEFAGCMKLVRLIKMYLNEPYCHVKGGMRDEYLWVLDLTDWIY
jgi:hypothetical protein